jgi:hypothetical protein
MTREEWWSCDCERHTFSVEFVAHLEDFDRCAVLNGCGTPPVRLHRRTRYAR